MRNEETSMIPGMLAFLAGVAVGAGLALVVSPKAGKEARKTLEDFTGDAQEGLSDLVDKGREVLEDLKSYVGDKGGKFYSAWRAAQKEFRA